MNTYNLHGASIYQLAYHARKRVERLIQEQDYRFLPSELADVVEGQLLPALEAIDYYDGAPSE